MKVRCFRLFEYAVVKIICLTKIVVLWKGKCCSSNWSSMTESIFLQAVVGVRKLISICYLDQKKRQHELPMVR